MAVCLSNFHHIRPRHELGQEEILSWIAQTHGRAAGSSQIEDQVRERIEQLGLGPERIRQRGTQIDDFTHLDWERMEVYPVGRQPDGAGFTQRSQLFDREASSIMEQFYESTALPAHLIHVTCTGYVSPSPAQKLVSRRRAGEQVTVTHAYHMGCYGAFPAIRMAGTNADLVHTEMCSLHLQPRRHTTDQLVVQGLFADGFIKYSVRPDHSGPNLRIISLREEVIPDSTHAMSWGCQDHGLGMTLSKDVPILIGRAIEGYLGRLCPQGWDNALFAVHPGGPKILTQVQAMLGLQPEQIVHSEQVLRDYGNMSSATLPHIWERMLLDPNVKRGTPIVSLAFGPGLTIAGGLFEKR